MPAVYGNLPNIWRQVDQDCFSAAAHLASLWVAERLIDDVAAAYTNAATTPASAATVRLTLNLRAVQDSQLPDTVVPDLINPHH